MTQELNHNKKHCQLNAASESSSQQSLPDFICAGTSRLYKEPNQRPNKRLGHSDGV